MLYIFHVDTGRMMTFDMKLALENVQYLKDTIERHHNIPASSQVLLVSGGEMLQSNARVCSYSAGTDTNPIYMFSTNIIESQNPPKPWPSIDAENDLKEKIEQCLDLPANYSTVVARTLLAQQCFELAKEETKICEKLVHEQHLQQQGWAAVVANMEDITEEFKERCADFYRIFDEHLERRQQYDQFVVDFERNLKKLSQIPILPGLVQCAEEQPFDAFDEYLKDSESFTKSVTSASGDVDATTSTLKQSTSVMKRNSRECTPGAGDISGTSIESDDTSEQPTDTSKDMSLLQWISANKYEQSLQHLAENSRRGLTLFDERTMMALKIRAQKAVDAAQQENIKEIRGLEDRLSGLDMLIFDAKKLVKEQGELTQAFQQNQIRANNLADASILPDLCASHCSQLLVMSKNDRLLRDIRRRITRAKEELATNLNRRLKYVVYIENQMYDIDNSLLFYHRCLCRLQRHLCIIEQVHKAPYMYVLAVTEVVRRRVFSNAFLMWAANLTCQLLTIHNEEVMRRHDFTSVFEGHFLSTLFPGMNDMPPSFATETPPIFDSSLPQLTQEDINLLAVHLPEITSNVKLPDLSAVIQFFSTKGFESETDTEEYEKVGQQSPIDGHQNTSSTGAVTLTASGCTQTSLAAVAASTQIRPETCNMSTSTEHITTQNNETLTEDNLGSTRLEVEKYKSLLKMMQTLTCDALNLLRQQLQDIKTSTQQERANFSEKINNLTTAWARIDDETKLHEREVVQRMTLDHELELNDIKKTLLTRDDEIGSLKQENQDLTENLSTKENDSIALDELKAHIKIMQEQIECATKDKEKAVADMKEKLIHEHRTEIESLRCRFKLMTSMERSPSDTSLEKIERADLMEYPHHESIINRAAKGLSIKSAGERRFDTQYYSSSSPKSPSTTAHDFYRRILEDKDGQIENLREHEVVLIKENMKLKETIQAVADSEPCGDVSTLRTQNDCLQRDKEKLEQDLVLERARRVELERRVTAGKSEMIVNRDVATSPDPSRSRSRLSGSQSSLFIKSAVTFDSCSPGDHVLVVWNSNHRQYIIAQDAPILFFLHGDSYSTLNLPNPQDKTSSSDSIPNIVYCICVVIDKQYCHARKDENRYRVSKGTKFYRVRVNPRKTESNKSSSSSSQKKPKLDPDAVGTVASESVLRSTSMEKCNQQQQQYQLISSFAQTDYPAMEASVTTSQGKDMVDSGVVTHQKSFKERNISVTEEDETTSLEDRCRYVSVSEEEELTQDISRSDERTPSGTGLFTLIETLFSLT